MTRRAGPALPPTATMRSPSIATSPAKRGAPVPSIMVPPLMTISCIAPASRPFWRLTWQHAARGLPAQRLPPHDAYADGLFLGMQGFRHLGTTGEVAPSKSPRMPVLTISAVVAVVY